MLIVDEFLDGNINTRITLNSLNRLRRELDRYVKNDRGIYVYNPLDAHIWNLHRSTNNFDLREQGREYMLYLMILHLDLEGHLASAWVASFDIYRIIEERNRLVIGLRMPVR